MSDTGDIGIVVIGRNEGERLRRCFESLGTPASNVIYVDSGSTDDSVTLARSVGINVVELETTIPFTAARARNAGFDSLISARPDVALVMFVDGDCEILAGWLEAARRAFAADSQLAVAAGRLRERFPGASIYNQLCDLEWHVPPGEVKSCGGIAVFRADAFRAAGGFNPRIIAGEEPELCVRLRAAGWRIVRLENEMALHDAAMTHFSQWWKRAVRAGHAYAEGTALYGGTDERYLVRESASGWLYGFFFPAAIALGVLFFGPWGLVPAFVYPVLALKIAIARRRTHGDRWSLALLYACACIVAKPAECLGQTRYWIRRAFGREPKILEHKLVNRG